MTGEAPPKLFEHCITVFAAMRKQAKPAEIEGTPGLVYEGYLTRLFADLGLAMPYYTAVMRRLKAMNCVKQLSRGGGSSPSKWELLNEPSFEEFDELDQKRRENDTQLGQAQSSIRGLTRRVSDLEEQVALLIDAQEAEAV